VVSFPKNSEENVLVVTLPDNALVDVPWGYGPYRMAAVWKLGELEHKPNLFPDTISDAFSIPIQGFVGETEPKLFDTIKFIAEFKKNFPLTRLLFDSKLTNLNFLDRWLLYWRVTSASQDLLVYNAHQNARLFQDTILVDGTEVKKVLLDGLKTFLEQKFEEAEIRKQAVTVEVKNTTDISGVGQKFANIISAAGGKVITIGNDKKTVAHCEIEVHDTSASKLLASFLAYEYRCQRLASSTTSGPDIIVRVGTDFGERWKNSTSY